jgi:hypothetical protein
MNPIPDKTIHSRFKHLRGKDYYGKNYSGRGECPACGADDGGIGAVAGATEGSNSAS